MTTVPRTGGSDRATVDATQLLISTQTSFSPVSQLPVDILLEIFRIVRDSAGRTLKDWHRITQICAHWRQVAVAAASLWTHIHDFPLRFIQLMLERSQAAPLHITLMYTPSIALLETILQEIERIHTLSLMNIGSSFSLKAIKSILANLGRKWEPLLLESLTINLLCIPRKAKKLLVVDIFRPTHRLRELSIYDGRYRWDILPFPNLTELVLYGEMMDTVSGTRFLESLGQMPKLQVLWIDWPGLKLTQYPPTPLPPPIHLPDLKRLELKRGSQVEIESFLSLIVHPGLHQLLIDCDPSTFTLPGQGVEPLTRSVLSSVARGGFDPLDCWKIESTRVSFCSIPWATHRGSYLRMSALTEEEADMEDYESVHVYDIMSSVARFSPSGTIHPKHVCFDSHHSSTELFFQFLLNLPPIEWIEVHHALAIVLIKILNDSSALGKAILNTATTFSKLQSITWHGEHRYSRTVPVFPAKLFDNLYNALITRLRSNVPIRRLELVSCHHLDDAQALQLQELGIEVVVRQK